VISATAEEPEKTPERIEIDNALREVVRISVYLDDILSDGRNRAYTLIKKSWGIRIRNSLKELSTLLEKHYEDKEQILSAFINDIEEGSKDK